MFFNLTGLTSSSCFIMTSSWALTILNLRLLSSKAQGCKDFWITSQPCHVGIHKIVIGKYSQMSTHVQGFQSLFYSFFASFCIDQISHQQHKGWNSVMIQLLDSCQWVCFSKWHGFVCSACRWGSLKSYHTLWCHRNSLLLGHLHLLNLLMSYFL